MKYAMISTNPPAAVIIRGRVRFMEGASGQPSAVSISGIMTP
jgi:hypothetical protein